MTCGEIFTSGFLLGRYIIPYRFSQRPITVLSTSVFSLIRSHHRSIFRSNNLGKIPLGGQAARFFDDDSGTYQSGSSPMHNVLGFLFFVGEGLVVLCRAMSLLSHRIDTNRILSDRFFLASWFALLSEYYYYYRYKAATEASSKKKKSSQSRCLRELPFACCHGPPRQRAKEALFDFSRRDDTHMAQ